MMFNPFFTNYSMIQHDFMRIMQFFLVKLFGLSNKSPTYPPAYVPELFCMTPSDSKKVMTNNNAENIKD